MTLHKKDLIMLAGSTLKWAAQNDCVKDGDNPYNYFTVEAWCAYFEHSVYTFKRVKREMVELGIAIAQRVMHGHYISDVPSDVTINMELALKNIITRLETMSALCDSSQKSKHSTEIMERLKEVVSNLDVQLNSKGAISFKSKSNLLTSVSGD